MFFKSRKTNGQAQSRVRFDLWIKLFEKKSDSPIGLINLNLNYKYTGKYIDWDGSKNSRQKSTDIIDLSITKNILRSTFSFKLTNLLNERYEKPATYSQEGRQIRLGFKSSFLNKF